MPPQPQSTAPRSLAGRPPGAPGVPSAPAPGVTVDPRKLLLQYWHWLVLAGIVGVALGFVVHFTLRFTYPLYDGQVVFTMLPPLETADQTASTVGAVGGEAEIKRFIGTQVQVLASSSILERTVNDPKVKSDTKWIRAFLGSGGNVDVKEAAKELRDIAYARQVPESNWVLLNVRTTSPQDSATIANAMKEAYLQNLKTGNLRESSDLMEAMNRRLNATQEERRLVEERKARLVGADGIESQEERFSFFAQQLEKLLPVKVGTSYNLKLQHAQMEQYEEQLQAPGGPTFPEIIRQEIDQHPLINFLSQQVSIAKANLKAERDRLGPNHTVVKRSQSQVDAYAAELEVKRDELLREAFTKLIDKSRGDIRSYEATLVETNEDIGAARTGQADVSKMMLQYETLEEDSKRLAEAAQNLSDRVAEQNAIIARSASNRVKVFSDADPPDRPAFPDIVVIVPLVAFLTLILTAAYIVLREALEQRVRGPADLASIPRVHVLGVIPDIAEDPSAPASIETAVADRPSGVIAEFVRQIRTELFKWLSKRESAVLLVVSGMPGSGGTSTIVNLAQSCAACERRVLIIDGNLRRPRMHAIFALPQTPGVGEVLSGAMTFEQAVRVDVRPGLDVLSAGTADARSFERFTTESMGRIIEEVRSRYDLVLIDAAPAIVSSDPLMLVGRCDGVIVVVRAYREKRGLVARIRSQLEESKAEFLGVIINAVRSSAGGYFRRNFRATHEYHNTFRENGLFEEPLQRGKRSRRAARREARLAAASEPAAAAAAKTNGEAPPEIRAESGGGH